MSTATTTIDAIRDAFETSIEAISPSNHSSVGFRVSLGEVSFREWAEAHPDAALRRFSILRVGSVEPGEVSDASVEEKLATLELVVAYPKQMALYGVENVRDMQALMQSDAAKINEAIGGSGYASWPSGLIDCQEIDTIEDGDAVSFLVHSFEIRFYKGPAT